MASKNTEKLNDSMPRQHPTLLGPYVFEMDPVTQKATGRMIRDKSNTVFADRNGREYELLLSGAVVRPGFKRLRGRKPHPRGGMRRYKHPIHISK